MLGPADGGVLALARAWARIGRNVMRTPWAHRAAARALLALLVAVLAYALLLLRPHAALAVRV